MKVKLTAKLLKCNSPFQLPATPSLVLVAEIVEALFVVGLLHAGAILLGMLAALLFVDPGMVAHAAAVPLPVGPIAPAPALPCAAAVPPRVTDVAALLLVPNALLVHLHLLFHLQADLEA
eukprot:GCRY01002226.1.p2 GENE.GCRY01002226.1~~GCRY01002226.1.p2  ORF type:complete len:120 (+),score=17.40 GCRY01002226.1:529-888(+)